MGRLSSTPVPYWMSDRGYYPPKDPRRAAHLRRIDTQERLNQRIFASSGDGSYAVLVTPADAESP